MKKNYIELPLANGFRVIIYKTADGMFVALENQNGYIVSDIKLNKEQEVFLRES